ncbi:transmembrane protein 202 isoform X1 [Bubalus bubalis]|uniref:transmembrane protein 202 isoform X1 n=2 Tax=Bubalus TaxID=9918 RepID=UPI001E1B8FD5|nr:transmembrane protein 202 isoform X1 [Bubalus bubalis]
MERREGNERALQSVYNISRTSHPTYRPILPRMHRFSSIPPYLRRFLQKSRSCVRHLCACSSGFNCVLLLCLSPLHWVQFVVLKDRQKLLTGLWTLCHHDLCWGNTLKAPYYLQFSRAFFLISAFTILIIIIWFSISLTKGPGDKTYIDLGISIFCFISGTCLLFCLIFFLVQVKLYSKNVLEPHFLIVYHINWLGSILYMMIGFLSVLNHLSSQVPPPDQNLLVIPIIRTRVGNMATVKLSLSEGDSGVSSCMSKAPERQLSSVVQSRAQAEAET